MCIVQLQTDLQTVQPTSRLHNWKPHVGTTTIQYTGTSTVYSSTQTCALYRCLLTDLQILQPNYRFVHRTRCTCHCIAQSCLDYLSRISHCAEWNYREHRITENEFQTCIDGLSKPITNQPNCTRFVITEFKTWAKYFVKICLFFSLRNTFCETKMVLLKNNAVTPTTTTPHTETNCITYHL